MLLLLLFPIGLLPRIRGMLSDFIEVNKITVSLDRLALASIK